MKKCLLYICALVLMSVLPVAAKARDIIVVGQVFSSADSEPIQGAEVWFKDTNIGTTTDAEGLFILRSLQPQKTLMVSMMGYRTVKVKLDYGHDQMLQIGMDENITLLDEVVLLPNADAAFLILERVRDERAKNNHLSNLSFSALVEEKNDLALLNIKQKWMQKRLFKEMISGAFQADDSTFVVPVYASRSRATLEVRPDSFGITPIDSLHTALNIFTDEQWSGFYKTYVPNVNLYSTYINVQGTNVLSPVARSARIYYYAAIEDSVALNDRKYYNLRVWPRTDAVPLFKGSLQVDSATAAIVGASLYLPYTHTFTFLNNLQVDQQYQAFGDRFLPTTNDVSVGMQVNLNLFEQQPVFGALMQSKKTYSSYKISEALDRDPIGELEVDSAYRAAAQLIDTVKDARVVRLAKAALDLILNQYVHIWQIDVGPVMNLFHYNRLEGATPRLSLRSGERFSRHFTFGGHYGYSFGDHKHKFGAMVKWQFGRNFDHELSAEYNNRVVRYGYDDIWIYDPSRVHEVDHLLSSFDMMRRARVQDVALRHQLEVKYRYYAQNLAFTTRLLGEKIYSNQFVPFVSNGVWIPEIQRAALQLNFRLSWKEHYLDYYFHRVYMKSSYPIVNISLEGGYYQFAQTSSFYGKFGIYAQQHVPVGFGRLHWAAQMNATLGAVPYPWLVISRGSRGAYYNCTDLMLISPFEFVSDTYGSLTLRYQTRGFLLGYIPYANKLGVREDLIFNMAYGGVVNPWSKKILDMPTWVRPWGKVPYMECGVGLSNIFHLVDVEFLFRLTYRNNPDATNFMVRWSIGLEL